MSDVDVLWGGGGRLSAQQDGCGRTKNICAKRQKALLDRFLLEHQSSVLAGPGEQEMQEQEVQLRRINIHLVLP